MVLGRPAAASPTLPCRDLLGGDGPIRIAPRDADWADETDLFGRSIGQRNHRPSMLQLKVTCYYGLSWESWESSEDFQELSQLILPNKPGAFRGEKSPSTVTYPGFARPPESIR
jgi:hypothetical protein